MGSINQRIARESFASLLHAVRIHLADDEGHGPELGAECGNERVKLSGILSLAQVPHVGLSLVPQNAAQLATRVRRQSCRQLLARKHEEIHCPRSVFNVPRIPVVREESRLTSRYGHQQNVPARSLRVKGAKLDAEPHARGTGVMPKRILANERPAGLPTTARELMH